MSDTEPSLELLRTHVTLWFWVSNSGNSSCLILSYPNNKTVSSYSGSENTEWTEDWMKHEDLLNDFFNNFEFLGVL